MFVIGPLIISDSLLGLINIPCVQMCASSLRMEKLHNYQVLGSTDIGSPLAGDLKRGLKCEIRRQWIWVDTPVTKLNYIILTMYGKTEQRGKMGSLASPALNRDFLAHTAQSQKPSFCAPLCLLVCCGLCASQATGPPPPSLYLLFFFVGVSAVCLILKWPLLRFSYRFYALIVVGESHMSLVVMWTAR